MNVKEEYIKEIVPRLTAKGISIEEATRIAIDEWKADLYSEEKYNADSFQHPE